MSDSLPPCGTVARQAPLSMGLFRQAYWSELPFPSPQDLSNPQTEPMSPGWQVNSSPLSYLGSPKSNVVKNKIPWRRKWQPTAIFLPGKSHGQRSPAGYSPQDLEESDVTEHILFNRIKIYLKI